MVDQSASESPLEAGHPRLRKTASVLFAGVASVVPVAGTIWLLVIIYKMLRAVGDAIIDGVMRVVNFLRGAEVWDALDLLKPIESRPPKVWEFDFPGATLLQALLPVLILFGIGFAVTNSPGRRALAWVEGKIARLPMLGFVYSGIKQVVDAVRDLGGERKFKGVAYIEYPSPGCRLLGFVTGNFRDAQTGRDVTSIFMPTSPNPLTGFVLIVDDEKVMNSEMSLEEASKMIVSAGLVAPLPVDAGGSGSKVATHPGDHPKVNPGEGE